MYVQILPGAVRVAVTLLALSSAAGALAQTPVVKPAAPAATPAAKPAPVAEEPAEVTSVTVSAERPTNRIDRQVYDVKSDIAASNSSAADVLDKVPSVTVDPEGKVSLRGNTSVQIMVDGKATAMLQGENRGSALTSMPAGDIASVEVINNPGAQFGNEGGGGPIINLVMRRERTPGGMGMVNANAGTSGRFNSSASGSYNAGRLSYQGGMHVRHDGRDSVSSSVRERRHPVTGEVSRSSAEGFTKGMNNSASLNGGLGYNLGDKDKLAFNGNYSKSENDNDSESRNLNLGAGTTPLSDYLRTSARSGTSENYSLGGRYEHNGALDGETLKLDLRLSGSDWSNENTNVTAYRLRPPGVPDRTDLQYSSTATSIADFTADYERPLGKGLFKTGFKSALNESSFDTRFSDVLPGTGQAVLNAARTNRYDMDEGNLALYGSYELRFNPQWAVLGGMRAEHTRVDIKQRTSATDAANSYTNFMPSFYVNYKASDKANVRLSYARRIRRPTAYDLNPFVVIWDELNASSGNPRLRPSKTDSIELGYDTSFGVVNANLRGYFRKETDVIVEKRYFISDTILLNTRENDGLNRSGGMEFTLNGKLSKELTVSTSGNAAYIEQHYIDATGKPATRKAPSLTMQGRVSYQLSAADHLQLSINAQGKTLFGQGYREPNTTAAMSWRHAFTPRLNLMVNVTDLFDSNKMVSIVDNGLVKDRSERRFDGRIIYVGLSYRLGGIDAPARGQARGRGQPPGGGRPEGAPGRF